MHAPLSFTSPATTKVSPRCYGPQVFALVSLWCEREDAISAQSESGGDAHITYTKFWIFGPPPPCPLILSSIGCSWDKLPSPLSADVICKSILGWQGTTHGGKAHHLSDQQLMFPFRRRPAAKKSHHPHPSVRPVRPVHVSSCVRPPAKTPNKSGARRSVVCGIPTSGGVRTCCRPSLPCSVVRGHVHFCENFGIFDTSPLI